MGGLAQLIGSWLSSLHQLVPDVCPGGWPWAVTLAGLLLAIAPALGAVLVALVRKGTGNSYHAPAIVTFAAFGLILGFLVPWLASIGMSNVFESAAAGNPGAVGLTGYGLHSGVCFGSFFGDQGHYLGGGHTGYEVLFHSSVGVWLGIYLAVLVGLPALSVLAVMLQQRLALRRGPTWPGRLMWLSVVLFWGLSLGGQANLMAQLWLGFLLGSIGGVLLVLVLGPPSWSVINRRRPEPAPAHVPPPQHSYPPEPYQSNQVPRPMAQQRPLSPTKVDLPVHLPAAPPLPPALPPPPRPTAQPVVEHRLADTPGPLPFGNRDATTVLWNSANGRFRRVRQLGHGGFGTVWLAVDTQLDRTVALKFAHAPDSDTQARMLREARALAAVHHPNCVRVYDIIEDVDGLGIVMEYIDGQPLSDAVFQHGPLDDVAAARLWSTMAGALGAAHSKNVLHRDVKPANILLDNDGLAHLIDFGIARAKGDVTLTAAGMMMGTPDFLAPETAATGVATPASDAWQVAATVSYALTGQPPRGHRANPMSALMAAAQRLPTTHLPDRSRHLPMLRAALDPEPSRRPTLTTVHRELNAWLATHGHSENGPVTTFVNAPVNAPLVSGPAANRLLR